jgi:serine/threonine-protein kinase HipA
LTWCRASVVELDVYLGTRLVGRVAGEPDQVRFQYTPEWVAREGVDIARVLPLQSEPLPPGPTRAFFDGLLPEASLREVLARDWGVDPLDTWALLAAIGRESAGAITILPAGEPLPSKGAVDWLTEEGLAEAIRRLPVAPLASDPSSPVRVSLGGVHDKLVLVHDGERWGLPHPGTPSTHIAKPDPERDWLPHLAVNEHVSTHWMLLIGLPAATTSLLTVARRRALISERFDRSGSWPDVERLHQEDFAQLTGRLSIHKYEQHGGPGVAECLQAISERSANPVADRRAFVETVWANTLLGNADGHAKNYALLLTQRAWRLAPAYDVLCTLAYEHVDHRSAMRLDGRDGGRMTDPDHLSGDQLSRALEQWGYRGAGRRRLAGRLAELAEVAIDVATPEHLPDTELTDREQHVGLLSREIRRRAGALAAAASAAGRT